MELKNLDFSFGQTPLFKNLNISFKQGTVTALLGPSGCGKSTLLKILSGLIPVPSSQFSFSYEQLLGFVFQDSSLLPWLNLQKNIMLPLEIKSENSIKLDQKLIQFLSLTEHLQKYPHQLSGGQRMRGSLARALAINPEYLFLDEPFSALDEMTRFKIQNEWSIIQKERHLTTLLVTHSISEAVYLADQIYIMTATQPVQVLGPFPVQKNFKDRFDSSYLDQVSVFSKTFAEKTGADL